MREHLERVIEGLLAATELEAVELARTQAAAKRSEYARRRAI
jgi:GntR family hexuronate regulon transcriptional repressor